MTIHESLHGQHCMCAGCYAVRAYAQAKARGREQQVSTTIPERDVHWTWLHGPIPPGTVPSPREAYEQRTAYRATERAS